MHFFSNSQAEKSKVLKKPHKLPDFTSKCNPTVKAV